MDPSVRWVQNEEFERAFENLILADRPGLSENEEPTMAAFTKTPDVQPEFPGFINIRFEDGKAVVTMRGDPVEVPEDGDNTAYLKPGKQTEATFTSHDWDQFVAEATRERGLVPGG